MRPHTSKNKSPTGSRKNPNRTRDREQAEGGTDRDGGKERRVEKDARQKACAGPLAEAGLGLVWAIAGRLAWAWTLNLAGLDGRRGRGKLSRWRAKTG